MRGFYFGCEESQEWSGFLEASPISQKQYMPDDYQRSKKEDMKS